MGGIDGLLAVLDTRAFVSVWYWLLLAGLWSWLGRGALGVPSELVRAVRAGQGDRVQRMLLLDWLSLVVPRWRIAPRDGAILTAIAGFAFASLAVLAVSGTQFAQALLLLAGPLAVLGALRLRLAAGLARILDAARDGQPVDDAARAAAAAISRHMRVTMVLSTASVTLAAVWATRWLALHPYGL